MDKIFIRDLTVMTVIGTRPDERLAVRPLAVNVVMECDLAPAGVSDDLCKSVNYQSVAEDLLQLGREKSFFLIEAFAENAAAGILKKYDLVSGVTVTVDKPYAIGAAGSVAVEITRRRR